MSKEKISEAQLANEQFVVTKAMQKYGGSFVQRLGAALERADPSNARKIKQAFPEYWAQYLKMGMQK